MRSRSLARCGVLVVSALLTGCVLEDDGPALDDGEIDALAASLQHPCGTMVAGESLSQGEQLVSCGGRFTLGLQGDGNLVLREQGVARWDTKTYASNSTQPCIMINLYGPTAFCTVRLGQTLAMQGDGNLVLYGVHWNEVMVGDDQIGGPVWNTRTTTPGARLALQDDGNLVVYDAANRPLWNRFASRGTLIP